MIVKVAGAGMPRDDEIHIVSRPVSMSIKHVTSHNDRTLNQDLNGMACVIMESSNMTYFITSDFYFIYPLPKPTPTPPSGHAVRMPSHSRVV